MVKYEFLGLRGKPRFISSVILLLSIMFFTTNAAYSQSLSSSDSLILSKYLPYKYMINENMTRYWPDLPLRSFLPALVEKETCISAKHKFCWSPTAELKTSREYGFGWGQFTVAYDAAGSVRFNAWEDAKNSHKDLANWEWADRLNPILTIKAITIKNSVAWRKATFPTATPIDRLAFVVSAYNGGSTYKDRILCSRTKNCDSARWFKQPGKLAVADVSTKSRVPVKGYGQSFYDINRGYVVHVLTKRNLKYIPYTG